MNTRLFGLPVCALFAAALMCAPLAPGLTATAAAQAEAAKPAPKPRAMKMDKSWEERTEQRIADLQAQLLVTAEQQKAFDDLAQAMRDNAKSARAAYEKWYKDVTKLSAVESLKAHAAMSQERAQAMARLVAVFEPFYKQLTDEQKKVADEVFSRHEGRKMARDKARGQKQ